MTHPALREAIRLCHDAHAAAEKKDLAAMARLDADRLQLLQSFRLDVKQVGREDRAMLVEIARLNDLPIGLLEHQRRGKGREMDMAAVGRRAVAAYAGVRLQR